MEWAIELESDGRVRRVTVTGRFQLDEQERMFEDLAGHHGPSPGAGILFDNRRLDLTGSDVESMRRSVEIVQRFVRSRPGQRLAGLVDAGVNFGVGRQFELLTDAAGGRGFRLFKDEQLALRWLRGESS